MASPIPSIGRIIVSANGPLSWKSSTKLIGTTITAPAVYIRPGPRNMRRFSTSEVKRETTSPERLLAWKENGRDASLSKSSALSPFSKRRETTTISQRW